MTERIVTKALINEDELNRDPVSGTPGAHPLGTGTGAASGGIAGAVAGMAVGGPVGSVIGAAVGAVAGGLAGKGAAEVVNPTAEEVYWRDTYVREPYYMSGKPYEYYAPGFRAGWEGRMRYHGSAFDADFAVAFDSHFQVFQNLADCSQMHFIGPIHANHGRSFRQSVAFQNHHAHPQKQRAQLRRHHERSSAEQTEQTAASSIVTGLATFPQDDGRGTALLLAAEHRLDEDRHQQRRATGA